jgi:hypothetical protein
MNVVSRPDFDEVRYKIETALQLLYRNDHFLITNSTNERSITHKLAEYIQQLFPEWHVDCEYNRLGRERPKAIPSQDTSYPDIIIHFRNTQDNLLIIEAKSIHSQDHSDISDKDKIKAYIENLNSGYQFGLWICFHDDLAKNKLDWFKNQAGICCGVSS